MMDESSQLMNIQVVQSAVEVSSGERKVSIDRLRPTKSLPTTSETAGRSTAVLIDDSETEPHVPPPSEESPTASVPVLTPSYIHDNGSYQSLQFTTSELHYGTYPKISFI